MWFCDYNADASRDNDRNTEPHLIEILAHCPSPPICWLLFPYVPLFPDLCSPVHICWQYLQSSIVLFCQDDQAEVSPPDSTLSTYHLPFTSVLYWLPWCFPCASGLCFTLSFSDVSFVWKAPVRKSCSPCCLFWSLGFKLQAATPLLPKLLILLPQLVQLFLFLLSSSLNYIFKLVLSVCVGVGGGVGVWVCLYLCGVAHTHAMCWAWRSEDNYPNSLLLPFGSWASNSGHQTWLSHLAGPFSGFSSSIPCYQLHCALARPLCWEFVICHLPLLIQELDAQGFLFFSPVFLFINIWISLLKIF